MNERRDWTEKELLVAFALYCRLPFGRLNSRTPDIVEAASAISRTPSAVSMKACNFASFDPQHKQRGVKGLGNASRADRELWEQYEADPDAIIARAGLAWVDVFGEDSDSAEATSEPSMELEMPEGPATATVVVNVRRLQGFFRKVVLSAYGNRCALSEIAQPELLNASHIIPWRDSEQHRLNPRNGIALNALYDRAFDRGFFTLDDDYRVIVSKDLPDELPIFHLHGKQLALPERFAPDPAFLSQHREVHFRK